MYYLTDAIKGGSAPMSIRFTDGMLKEAIIKADRYEMEALPADDKIKYEFSPSIFLYKNVLWIRLPAQRP